MSTVKISQLPILTSLGSNTSNTILVGIDISTSVTGRFTAKVLADVLYANTPLNVGNNQITFPGTVAQFVGNNENYLQINLQNKNGSGSSDFVVTANNGTDSIYYGDFGIAGSTDNDVVYGAILPLDTYLYSQGNSSGDAGGNLVIGTATTGKTIKFIAGGTSNTDYVAQLSTDGFQLLKKPLIFADGTTQNTSATSTSTSSASFANGAFLRSNSSYDQANSGASFANGSFVTANAAASFANGAFETANAAASFANGAFITANSSADFANGSFNKANSSASFANGAFVTANSGSSFANSAFVTANAAASFANGAFTAANSSVMAATNANGAFNRANSGYGVANSGAIFANSAFLVANSASSNTITTQGVDLTQNTNITSAQSFANGAFAHANAAYDQANTGGTDVWVRTQANNSYNTANSAASFANGAFTSANSGWTKANSAFSLAGTQAGRLDVIEPIAQEAFTVAQSALDLATGGSAAWLPLRANSAAIFANAAYAHANAAYAQANTGGSDVWVRIQANNAYNTANSGAVFANGAFVTANNGYEQANSAGSFANGAFDRANAAYAQANTGGTDTWVRTQANNSYDTANSGASFANGAFLTANSGASFANGAFDKSNTAATNAQAAFNFANTTSNILLTFSATTVLDVSASGSSAYIFSQYTGLNNPNISTFSATTLGFNLASVSASHPFHIRTGDNSADFDTGLVHISPTGTISYGSAAQGKTSGLLLWRIPHTSVGNYKYRCSAHGSMIGNINIANTAGIYFAYSS